LLAGALLFLGGACAGGDDGNASPTQPGASTPAGHTLSPLEQKLASVVLQPNEVPTGMDAGAPDFTTNEELAGADQAELQRLMDLGRQLGVDVQFIPTGNLEEGSPLRGLQSSARVYTSDSGARQTFQETASQSRAHDWAADYPELEDAQSAEMPQQVGDESLWIRITGQQGCTFIASPTPDPQGVVPTQECLDTMLLIVDEIIFRVGRTYNYLRVISLFPPLAPRDTTYVAPINSWTTLVTQRAAAEFPG